MTSSYEDVNFFISINKFIVMMVLLIVLDESDSCASHVT